MVSIALSLPSNSKFLECNINEDNISSNFKIKYPCRFTFRPCFQQFLAHVATLFNQNNMREFAVLNIAMQKMILISDIAFCYHVLVYPSSYFHKDVGGTKISCSTVRLDEIERYVSRSRVSYYDTEYNHHRIIE